MQLCNRKEESVVEGLRDRNRGRKTTTCEGIATEIGDVCHLAREISRFTHFVNVFHQSINTIKLTFRLMVGSWTVILKNRYLDRNS